MSKLLTVNNMSSVPHTIGIKSSIWLFPILILKVCQRKTCTVSAIVAFHTSIHPCSKTFRRSHIINSQTAVKFSEVYVVVLIKSSTQTISVPRPYQAFTFPITKHQWVTGSHSFQMAACNTGRHQLQLQYAWWQDESNWGDKGKQCYVGLYANVYQTRKQCLSVSVKRNE